jgi:hypothetical protein
LFLSSVQYLMALKVAFLWKLFFTKKTAISFHSIVTFKWFWWLPNTLNYFVHWWQLKSFSPMWTLVQILRMSILLNDFVQKKAPEGILPGVHSLKLFWRMCPLVCFWTTQNTKLFCTLKAVVGILIRVYSFHVVHKDTFVWKPYFTNKQLYGFSPVCSLSWSWSLSFRENNLLQNEQLKCSSPECSLTWVWRISFRVNDLLHNEQL